MSCVDVASNFICVSWMRASLQAQVQDRDASNTVDTGAMAQLITFVLWPVIIQMHGACLRHANMLHKHFMSTS